MRKIFKVLSYSLLYLIISIASAYGVITISMNNYNKSQNPDDPTVVVAEEITTMINHITSSSALGLDLDIEVGASGQVFDIAIDGNIDFSDGFENLAVDAIINVALSQDSSFDIGVVYKDGNLYFELLNNKFFIETDNLMTSLNQVLGLVGVELPDIDSILGSLSLDSILGMLSNFEEIVAEDGSLILQVALPVVEQINLICTPEYKLTGLSLPQATIEGVELAVNGDIDYPEEVIIEDEDSSNYINLTNVIDLACGIIDFASQEQIGLEYNVVYNNIDLAGRIDINMASKAVRITLGLDQLEANLIFIDNTLYLEAYNIYAKFSIGQVGEVVTLVEKYFNFDLPDELIASVVSAIESGDFSELLDSFELPAIDLGSIDLSILESIVKNGDVTSISIADIGKIDVTLSDGKLSSIGFNGLGANALLSTTNFTDFALTTATENYIDIAKLIPTLDNILAILQNNTFSGSAVITYKEYSFDVNYTIHTRENNKFITLSTSVFGQNIKLNIFNNKAYLEISETKLVCQLNNLENVINKVLATFGVEFDSSSLTDGLKSLINSEINPLLITSFIENENGISIALLDKLTITLTNATNELKLDANYQDLTVSANVIGSEQELTVPVITESQYSPIEDIVDSVINVYDYVLAKTFYLSFDASYQDIKVEGALNYDVNGLSATATLTYQSLTANVMLYENKVYITAENIKLVFNLSDIDYVKTFLNQYFGVDVEGMLNEILGKVGINLNSEEDSDMLSSILNGLDIEALLSGATFNISTNSITLSALDGLGVNITLVDKMINKINVNYTITGENEEQTTISANLSIEKEINKFSVADESEYIDVVELLDIVKAFIDFASQEQLAMNYQVSYDELILSGKLDLNIAEKTAKLSINLNDSIKANVIYSDGMLYFEAYNIYAKFSIGQVGEVVTLVEKYFNFDLPDELIASVVSAIESGDFSELLDSFELPAIDLGSIDLSILESIVKNGDVTSISIADIGKIDVTLSDGKLSSIGFNGLGANALLSTTNFTDFALTTATENYIDIAKLIPTLDNILAILQNNTFSGSAVITYKEYSFDVNYTIHTRENNKFITLSTSVFGQNIKLNIFNNKAYLEISETKLVCQLNNLENVINKVLATFGVEFDSSSLTDGLKSLINSEINPLLITSFIENENGISIALLDKLTITLTNATNELKLDANYQDLTVSANVIGSEQELTVPVITESQYSPIEDIVDSVINVYDYVLAKTFYLSFDASYQDIKVEGALNYDVNGLSATATLTYQSLTANVMLYENKVYITAENIKLVFNLSDIDYVKTFLNQYFGVDVEGMLNEILGKVGINLNSEEDSDMLSSILNGLDIEALLSGATFNISSNSITLSALDGLGVNITLVDKMINKVNVNYQLTDGENSSAINANITVEQMASIFNPVGDYTDVSTMLSYVELLLDYVNTKKMQFGINVNYGEKNITGNVQLDITSMLLMSASLSSEDIENFDLNANIENGMFYIDYSGLCLKIDNENFKELIVIVLEVLGIDSNSIPFLENVDLGLDFSQIETDIASLEISIDDIVNILKLVKGIELKDNSLDIILDGKSIYNNQNASDMIISLTKENGAIKSLTLSNIYLDDTLETKIDVTLTFETLSKFNYVDQNKNYIDISGSNELVKALINMTIDTDFHVQGSFDIIGSLAGFDISWNVPFDFKINVVGKGDIELYGVIGEIPAMIGVNNDVPPQVGDTESGSDRYLYIYYKAGYVYFYRSEKVDIMFGISSRTYEKCTKISIDTLLADPFYYIQYCFGFTDTIMKAIKDSMNNPRTEPMDFGNIIYSFTVLDNKNFTINLNMRELTNNPDLDSLIVSLGIKKTAEGKNYVGKLQLSLYMPLADIFTLTLSTSDTQIVDYGTEVDMSPLYDFINNYKYGNETEWEASNGNWEMSSEILYQVNFVTNSSETIETQDYHYKDGLNLPTLSDYVVDDGITHVNYHFAGWYEDETFTTEFTNDTMPRGDINLYAKWELTTKNYYTIDFVTYSDDKIDSITKLEGESINIPTLTTKEVTEENFTSYYEFAGWYTSGDFAEGTLFNSNIMPSRNTTLYAKWNLIKTEYTRLVNVYDGEELLLSERFKVGDTIDFSSIEKVNDTTKFYLDSSFTTELTNFTIQDKDLNIYIRNMYTLTFTSAYGNTKTVTLQLYQGENITDKIPEQASYVYDDGTQTAQITYTFNGYNSDTVMPNHDVTYSADWNVDEKLYYTVSFDLRWYLVLGCTAGSKMKDSPSPIASFKELEGTTIDLKQYAPTCTAYLTAFPIDAKNFKATSWGTSAWGDYTDGGSGFTSITITGDTTLYACWERV